MPSPQTIDIEALLNPVAGDNPAGEELRYEGTYDTLQEQMREDDDLEKGDWQRETKTADWRAVIATATEALATKSKDLQIAAWLTRGLVKRHGFAGLRDGFHFLRELQERFWDHLYPELDGDDAEFRAGPLESLNGTLPLFIQQVVLTQSLNGDAYTFIHWNEAKTVDNLARQNSEAFQEAVDEGKITSELFNKAVETTPRAFYETLYEDVQQCVEECEQLDRVTDEKFGRDAPSFVAIKKVLDEYLDLIRRIRKEKREREGVKDEESAESTATELQPDGAAAPLPLQEGMSMVATAPAARGTFTLEPQSRADAMRRLEAVATFFRRTEPHSPVAYLVERAVRWGAMPLEKWLQEVIKDDSVLGYVREHLGIPQGESNSEDSSDSSDES
ncbi:MAG: type VI secretion system protein TssA [Candidatus Binatia bacterium]